MTRSSVVRRTLLSKVVTETTSSTVSWAVVGTALLYLAIDLRFLHRIAGVTAEASDFWLVFFILVLMGLGILDPAIRAVIKPRLLIAVGTEGVTVSVERFRKN